MSAAAHATNVHPNLRVILWLPVFVVVALALLFWLFRWGTKGVFRRKG